MPLPFVALEQDPPPVPLRRRPPADDNRQLLTLLGQDVFYGAPGEPPADDPDWKPLPRPPRLRGIHDVPIIPCLLQATKFYGADGEPPPAYNGGPPLPIPRRTADKEHLNLVIAELYGQDQFFGALGQPAPNLDWHPPPRPWPLPAGSAIADAQGVLYNFGYAAVTVTEGADTMAATAASPFAFPDVVTAQQIGTPE